MDPSSPPLMSHTYKVIAGALEHFRSSGTGVGGAEGIEIPTQQIRWF